MHPQVPSTQEASSYFEEKMVPSTARFGEEKSIDTHFCQWLESISLLSTFTSKISTMCSHRTWFTFRVKLQSNRMAVQQQSKKYIRSSCSKPYATLKFFASYAESLAFFIKVAFLCQTLPCTTSTRANNSL